jgi:uroporphyrinogen-III synthase
MYKQSAKKEEKKERIIEAASSLFSQKNYHEVMMEDVAKKVSVAKGTVYNYFTSKEELYFTIMLMRMGKLNSSLKEKIENEKSTIRALYSFVIHLYMFMLKYRSFFLIYQKETMKADNELCSELLNHERTLNNLLYGIIGKGKKENLFRDTEEELASNLILGSIYGAVYRGIEKNFSESEMIEEREKVFNFILHGLFMGNEKDALPLLNKTLVLTRTIEQSNESAEIFRQLGANVLIFPTLDIVPPLSWKEFDECFQSGSKIDYIVFTSAHAVQMSLQRITELRINLDFDKIKIAALGNKTSSVCGKNKIPVHIVPQKFSADGLISELKNYNIKGKTVFIPRSAIGREELPAGLKEMGAIIKTAPVYNVAVPSDEVIKINSQKLKENKPDIFIFTSPSTFENYLQIMKIKNPVAYFNGYKIAAIGPTTKSAIEDKSVNVDILPDEFTIDGLVKAIIKFYK